MNENNFSDKKEFNNVEVLEPISLSNDTTINNLVGLNNIDNLNVSNTKSEVSLNVSLQRELSSFQNSANVNNTTKISDRDSFKMDSTLSTSNSNVNSMEDRNTDAIDLIPKTLGNFFFHYLFHSVKWFF